MYFSYLNVLSKYKLRNNEKARKEINSIYIFDISKKFYLTIHFKIG